MTIYMDSSVMDALNQKHGRWQMLRRLVESGETLACSVMTVTEIYAGLRPHEVSADRVFLGRIGTLPSRP